MPYLYPPVNPFLASIGPDGESNRSQPTSFNPQAIAEGAHHEYRIPSNPENPQPPTSQDSELQPTSNETASTQEITRPPPIQSEPASRQDEDEDEDEDEDDSTKSEDTTPEEENTTIDRVTLDLATLSNPMCVTPEDETQIFPVVTLPLQRFSAAGGIQISYCFRGRDPYYWRVARFHWSLAAAAPQPIHLGILRRATLRLYSDGIIAMGWSRLDQIIEFELSQAFRNGIITARMCRALWCED